MISWGSLYYAFSVFLHPTGTAQGWTQEQMVGAYSLSLLICGLCAYPVGRLIHQFGGRAVMSLGSVTAAAAFGLLSTSNSLATFYVAWAIAGVAMACTLYEAAFSVLAGLYSSEYKRVVTTIT
jgi:MFS family permease